MSPSQDTLNKPLHLDKTVPVHFVGVGGIGMSGLAKVLLESGFCVSGSDVSENAVTAQLSEMGAKIYKGHAAEQVPANAQVIVSSSIDSANPEIAVAQRQGLGIYHRSSLLKEILQGEQMGHETTVGITGTHGKTTITGMTGLALKGAKLDPTIVVGGKMPGLETNAVLGKTRKVAVAELDESDGTILQYQPTISVIANLELDHADHYSDGLSGVMNTFRDYLAALKPGSKVLYNVSDPHTKTLSEENPSHVEAILLAAGDVFTGDETQTTYWLKNARNFGHGCYQAYVYRNKKMLGELNVSVPGRHNLMNALCAVAVGDQLDADFDDMAPAIESFTGMGRRFEKVGNVNHALLVDDYAHHPTEVKATLRAAKEAVQGTGGRVIAVFQPHRFTRLQALWHEFAACFTDADVLILTDVYSAHEAEIAGVNSQKLTEASGHPNGRYVPLDADFAQLRDALKGDLKSGDIVLSMGAGNITHLLRNWTP